MKKWFVAAYLAALICASAQTYEQKIASAMESVDRVAAKGLQPRLEIPRILPGA